MSGVECMSSGGIDQGVEGNGSNAVAPWAAVAAGKGLDIWLLGGVLVAADAAPNTP